MDEYDFLHTQWRTSKNGNEYRKIPSGCVTIFDANKFGTGPHQYKWAYDGDFSENSYENETAAKLAFWRSVLEGNL